MPNIGDAWLGGYFTGIIDATKGNIVGTDYYQSGQRYAVIVAPKSLESNQKWNTTGAAGPTSSQTLWNGLDATATMNSATYPAAQYCAGLAKPSGDSASGWYLPALDELELMWRNLKPVTANNSTSIGSGWPGGTLANGKNASSDPAGAAYTTSIPAQTTVALFQSGGAQALTQDYYLTCTLYNTTRAWAQYFTSGGQQNSYANNGASAYVRPVRRLILT